MSYPDAGRCPVCDEEAISMERSPYGDYSCKHHHKWNYNTQKAKTSKEEPDYKVFKCEEYWVATHRDHLYLSGIGMDPLEALGELLRVISFVKEKPT